VLLNFGLFSILIRFDFTKTITINLCNLCNTSISNFFSSLTARTLFWSLFHCFETLWSLRFRPAAHPIRRILKSHLQTCYWNRQQL